MAFVRSKTLPKSKKYRGGFTDFTGKQVLFTGTTNRQETLAMARRFEDEHRQIRLGYREAPKSYDEAKGRLFTDVTSEYLAWGKAQGGIGGRPWSAKHCQKRYFYLGHWQKTLGLKVLSDLDGVLPRLEEGLRALQKKGLPRVSRNGKPLPPIPASGKTLQNYADGLRAFCMWAVNRGLLKDDPLKGMATFDTTPTTRRRALTADEVHQLLNSIDEDGTVWAKRRRMGYELALASGLRAGELRALMVKNLDVKRSGLNLEAKWTKNRQTGFHPLPLYLVERLAELSMGKSPDDPLVFVARETSSSLQADLERAGLKKFGPGGKVDFHAFRVAYTSFVVESGTDLKTAQTLARHSSPNLTMNTYARARQDRLAEVAETVGESIRTVAPVVILKTGTDNAIVSKSEPQNTALLRHQQIEKERNTISANGLNKESAGVQIPLCPPFLIPQKSNYITSQTTQNADSSYGSSTPSSFSSLGYNASSIPVPRSIPPNDAGRTRSALRNGTV
jgi:integrase